MSSLFSLEGKVAIVTGASRWTGGAIATEMAKAGADVVVAARTAEGLEKVAGQIREIGKRSLAVPTDVTNNDQVQNMVNKTLEEFGRIDILVNCAGGDILKPSLEMSEEDWDSMVKLNLTSHFLCSKAVAPAMIKQGGGSIIDIASGEGLRAAITNPAYGAAKAGVMNLVMTLGSEWGKHKIRVNAVAPGFIDNPLFEFAMGIPELKEIYDRIPLGRAVKLEEIAAAVIYFASDAGAYTTGVTLTLDGGMTTRLG